ncbi:hypothetical protein RsTz2092_03320 [Deferribacterales bacterium RsTz2092]|nr:hypothetical protein AGMMS49941_09770 [Deferribacterales bacterium]
MSRSEILSVLSANLNMSFTETDVIENIADWDSLSWLQLVVTIGDKFSKTLSFGELQSFKTIKDIVDFIVK